MKQTIIVFTRHDLTQDQIDAAWKIAAEKKGVNLSRRKGLSSHFFEVFGFD
jgi:hypothetical protein